MENKFEDFLKITTSYALKEISRSCSNNYFCTKQNIQLERKETTAEHIYSCLKLADYFLSLEEFSSLDKLKVYELLMYHDDIEIEEDDICISQREQRKLKQENEVKALPILASKYPKILQEKLIKMDSEFRIRKTAEAKFAYAIDRMDAIIHELKYPQDWKPKGFSEENVRKWSQPGFEYSKTFMEYFEMIIKYLNERKYFYN